MIEAVDTQTCVFVRIEAPSALNGWVQEAVGKIKHMDVNKIQKENKNQRSVWISVFLLFGVFRVLFVTVMKFFLEYMV